LRRFFKPFAADADGSQPWPAPLTHKWFMCWHATRTSASCTRDSSAAQSSGVHGRASAPVCSLSAPAVACSGAGQRVFVFGSGTDNGIWWNYSLNAGTNWVGWATIGQGAVFSAVLSLIQEENGA